MLPGFGSIDCLGTSPNPTFNLLRINTSGDILIEMVQNSAFDENDNPIVCPNCKASKSEAFYNRKGIFYKLFPFFEKRKYKCLNCGIITKP